MKKTILQGATLVSLLFGVSACASQRPVLSSNQHLMRVGREVGERESDESIARAEGASTGSVEASKENVVSGAATSSVVGRRQGVPGVRSFGRQVKVPQQVL